MFNNLYEQIREEKIQVESLIESKNNEDLYKEEITQIDANFDAIKKPLQEEIDNYENYNVRLTEEENSNVILTLNSIIKKEAQKAEEKKERLVKKAKEEKEAFAIEQRLAFEKSAIQRIYDLLVVRRKKVASIKGVYTKRLNAIKKQMQEEMQAQIENNNFDFIVDNTFANELLEKQKQVLKISEKLDKIYDLLKEYVKDPESYSLEDLRDLRTTLNFKMDAFDISDELLSEITKNDIVKEERTAKKKADDVVTTTSDNNEIVKDCLHILKIAKTTSEIDRAIFILNDNNLAEQEKDLMSKLISKKTEIEKNNKGITLLEYVKGINSRFEAVEKDIEIISDLLKNNENKDKIEIEIKNCKESISNLEEELKNIMKNGMSIDGKYFEKLSDFKNKIAELESKLKQQNNIKGSETNDRLYDEFINATSIFSMNMTKNSYDKICLMYKKIKVSLLETDKIKQCQMKMMAIEKQYQGHIFEDIKSCIEKSKTKKELRIIENGLSEICDESNKNILKGLISEKEKAIDMFGSSDVEIKINELSPRNYK